MVFHTGLLCSYISTGGRCCTAHAEDKDTIGSTSLCRKGLGIFKHTTNAVPSLSFPVMQATCQVCVPQSKEIEIHLNEPNCVERDTRYIYSAEEGLGFCICFYSALVDLHLHLLNGNVLIIIIGEGCINH